MSTPRPDPLQRDWTLPGGGTPPDQGAPLDARLVRRAFRRRWLEELRAEAHRRTRRHPDRVLSLADLERTIASYRAEARERRITPTDNVLERVFSPHDWACVGNRWWHPEWAPRARLIKTWRLKAMAGRRRDEA